MAVRYLSATGTQALINEIKQRLALKADLTSLQALQQALDTVAASIPTNLSQLSNDADFVTATQVGDTYATKSSVTGLSDIVTQNQDAINLLNANDQTPGSVDYKIAQAGTVVIDVYQLTAESEIPEYFLGRCDINDSLTITTDQGRDKWWFERTGSPVSFYKETAYSIVSEPFVVPITSERQNLAAVGQAIYRVRGRLENGAWTITPTRLYTERSIFNYEIEELFV